MAEHRCGAGGGSDRPAGAATPVASTTAGSAVRQSIRLGTWRGVAVGANWSVLLIVALLAGELAEYVLPVASGHPDAGDWAAGIAAAVVLLGSILLHEMAHALLAVRDGVRIRSITLFAFGGVTELRGEATTAGADFRIAAAGPAVSVVLAGAFRGLEVAAAAAGAPGAVVSTLSWLWQANLLLAVFNLIPAAPLDGGRILRDWLWRRSGDRLRATAAAARLGEGFGVLLVCLGFVAFLSVGLVGLWPALIGFFLYSSARSEESDARARQSLAGLRVGHVMWTRPPVVPGRATLEEIAAGHLWGYQGRAAAVSDDRGGLAGVLTAAAVAAVPAERRRSTTAGDLAVPMADVPVGRPDEPLSDLAERMRASGGHPAVVLDPGGRLIGIVSPEDVQRALAGAGAW